MNTFRVFVTGSREWRDRSVIYNALDRVLAEFIAPLKLEDPWQLQVMHGGCPRGADAIASDWCEMKRGLVVVGESVEPAVQEVVCHAYWNIHGKRAGMIRNVQMVEAGHNLCLAFFQREAANKGTSHCSEQALRTGIEVRRFESEE